ncbi:MAG: hypothetical protein GMKNLPBB_00957 [Myxococcota bacterium]|nr:hypothetical protein [Myxococcota bacterium]
MIHAIKELYNIGSMELWFQLGVSVFALAVIIERIVVLYFRSSLDPKKFFQEVQKRVMSGNVDDAIRMCGSAPIAKVVKAGLLKSEFRVIDIEQAMDEASLEAIPELEKRLPYLAMASNAAVLIGLLGTIEGMIQCFAAVAGADPAKKSAILSKGISVAMNATALGLMIAIPCIVVHSFLSAKSVHLVEDIKVTSAAVVNLFRIKKAEEEAEL